MGAPPVRDGAVVFQGRRILAVGPARELVPRYPDADVRDFGDAALLPGLVNAHVHLELSDLTTDMFDGKDFIAWLGAVVRRTSEGSESPAAQAARAVELGIAESLRYGVTTVGDISRFSAESRRILASAPLDAVSFGEVVAMGERRVLLEERLAAAIDRSNEVEHLRIGISPHAPYSIEAEGYLRCVQTARALRMPITTHLAESTYEDEFLASHSGPFRALWDRIGGWDDRVPRFEGGPIRFAKTIGLLGLPALLAHVNYADDAELDILAGGSASVVYCPRTHAYFGHPPHPWRRMLESGINVVVGTDSRASSPDLNLVEDLRLLHIIAPDVESMLLWEMATTRAARALGCDDRVGRLAPGMAAKIVVFPTSGDDPLRSILESSVLPIAVFSGL